MQFFLYPEHLNELAQELRILQQRTKRKNRLHQADERAHERARPVTMRRPVSKKPDVAKAVARIEAIYARRTKAANKKWDRWFRNYNRRLRRAT